MEPSQIAIPIQVRPDEVARKQTLGGAIELCAELAGHALDKSLQTELGVDKAQFSRWLSGQEGIVWPKLQKLMDACGNDAPLFWMLHQQGYDLHSIRKRETEYQRKCRESEEREAAANERARKAEEKAEFLAKLIQGKVVA
jgi:plasmid maintenance system antidote protein VapI